MKAANRQQTSLFWLIFSFAIYVRDAGVAGSNPATPTSFLTLSDPYRDSYRDRNDPATADADIFQRDDGLFEIGLGADAPGPFQTRAFALKVAIGAEPAAVRK